MTDYSKRKENDRYPYNGSVGIELGAKERRRQVEELGTDEMLKDHPEWYENNQMALAAAAYAIPYEYDSERRRLWPSNWDGQMWKPTPGNRIKELTKAIGLIAAEIDRLTDLQNTQS